MGSYSPTVQVQGIGLAAVKGSLDSLAAAVQLDVDGYGVVTVEEKSAAGGTLEKVEKLALDDYSVSVVPGRPAGKWFNYIVNFTQFA
jgi:heterodisulfide reductase subunit A-like polyferredoxin